MKIHICPRCKPHPETTYENVAFVAAGFEHSIANMSIFTISLLGNSPDTVSLYGLLYNLAWVSFGNVIGGAGFIGFAYYLTGHSITNR